MDFSKSEYAVRAQNLMKMASALRDVGAQTYIDIPRIAVIGGQSAGKSSLVEAVSGIRVPRSSGTCTRCPMEVNLHRQAGKWMCQIALRFEFDPSGARQKSTVRIPFGGPLHSPDGMEVWLMRAQVAVLNYPTYNPDHFLKMSESELNQYRSREAFENGTLKFSKNTVCVDISDPDTIDLSFVDLPGLIQNEARETVDLVESLVKSVIQGQCLILVAIPMSDDMENQRSMRLALETDHDKTRTIGVLTKPDTVSAGSSGAHQKWMDILQGNDSAYALDLGYYCVKLSDDNERAQISSRKERQRREETYFATAQPWSHFLHREQLGVRNLMLSLSKHLTALLDKVLPNLRDQANVQLSSLQKQFADIPEPVVNADATTEVLHRLDQFCDDLKKSVYGLDVDHDSIMGNRPSYVQQNRSAYMSLKDTIASSAPDFRPFTDNEGQEAVAQDDASEGDDETLVDSPRESRSPIDTIRKADSRAVGQGRVYNLKDVRKVIQYATSWELPDNVPYPAKKVLIDNFVQSWKSPTMICFNGIAARLNEKLTEHVDKNFDQFPRMRDYVRSMVEDLFVEQKAFARSAVENTLLLEEDAPYAPYTQNIEYLGAGKEKWITKFRDLRAAQCQDSRGPDMASFIAREFGIPLSKFQDGLRQIVEKGFQSGFDAPNPHDFLRVTALEYGKELEVMAEVRAYFDVSYKRVIDNIPLTIESALNRTLSKTIKTKIVQKMNLKDPATITALDEMLREDPEVDLRRKDLQTKIASLNEVVTGMREFKMK